MNNSYFRGILTGLFIALCIFIGYMFARLENSVFAPPPTATELPTEVPSVTQFVIPSETNTPIATATIQPTNTILPSSPLPSLTPTQTLKPPPTFEPPTNTPHPSASPTLTSTRSSFVNVTAPAGLQGLDVLDENGNTPEGCEKREDWQLRYTVQAGDALSNIATSYGTFTSELVLGNCLEDADTIVAGQVLRVPGDVQPQVPKYECTEWEVLTPFDGAYTIDGDDTISFVWRGPVAERYLVRVVQPSGKIFEELVDRQQNLQVFLPAKLREEGNHHWYVYPLGLDFLQIPCQEGGPWYFFKTEPTIPLTYTPSPTPTITDTPEVWEQTATARANSG